MMTMNDKLEGFSNRDLAAHFVTQLYELPERTGKNHEYTSRKMVRWLGFERGTVCLQLSQTYSVAFLTDFDHK
jgi:hypothetical protein